MNTKYLIGLIVLVLAGVGIWYVVAGQNSDPSDQQSQQDQQSPTLSIATSIYPLAYITERIVGEQGVVTNIGAGQDPHDFRPSTRDIQTLVDADLVILQGAELEPWGDDVRAQLERENVPLVIATEGLALYEVSEHKDHDEHGHDEHEDEHGHDEGHEHEDEHNHGAYDPHTWMSAELMIAKATKIADRLSELDGAHTETYQQNLAQLRVDLEMLDNEYASKLTQCSADEVITTHDAFGYIARAYDFTIHTIAGISTQDSPSVQKLAELRAEAEEGVRYILLEENSITAYGETLASETGLETLSIDPIITASPDGGDYLSQMRSNLETFRVALDCE